MSTRTLLPLRSRTVAVDAPLTLLVACEPWRVEAARLVRASLWWDVAQENITIAFLQRARLVLRHSKVLADQRMVIANVGGGAGENDASGVEQHYIVGESERQIHV